MSLAGEIDIWNSRPSEEGAQGLDNPGMNCPQELDKCGWKIVALKLDSSYPIIFRLGVWQFQLKDKLDWSYTTSSGGMMFIVVRQLQWMNELSWNHKIIIGTRRLSQKMDI